AVCTAPLVPYTTLFRSKTPRPEHTAAMTQTTVDTRLTGMPSSEARSSLSADARTAIPNRVKRKNAPSPTITAATTTGITKALPRSEEHTSELQSLAYLV